MVDAALQGSCAAAMRAVVLPLWRRLLAAGETDSLWLEWPTARAPLTLHLRLHPDGDTRAHAWLQADARDGGVAISSVPAAANPFADVRLPLDADAEIVQGGFTCLARAAAVYLASIGDADDEDARASTYAERQHLLLTLVQRAVEAMSSDRTTQQAYLTFHRDWLLRYPVLQRSHGRAKVQQLFDLLDAQADQTLAAAGTDWHAQRAEPRTDAPQAAWATAVSELAARVSCFAADPGCQLDPFADGPLFPVLFRLLHAAARQCGIALLDEACLYHLLLRADGADAGASAFNLAPPLASLPDAATIGEATPPGSLEELYPWPRLIARSGDEGRAWMATYASSLRTLDGAVERALRLLREGQLDEGASLLARMDAHRRAIARTQPGVYHTLGRFYHGEQAYYLYRIGDLSAADHELDLAAASVAEAIEQHAFLIPLAPLVIDIPLQKARLARSRQDWRGMEQQLRVMYEMEAGIRPLCVLRDGTAIGYDTVAARLAPQSPAGGIASAAAAGGAAASVATDTPEAPAGELRVLRLANRLDDFRRMAGHLYLTSNLVRLDSPLPD